MTRPRRSFGDQPGRVVATMLRALAAELSDPGRYSRAKSYARDGAVIEIDVRPEVVSGLVLGSRREPYEVFLVADPAPAEEIAAARPAVLGTMTMLTPGRDELAVSCTCPDADGAIGTLCKHAVALLLVLADETSIEPELLVRWRTKDDDTAGDRRPRRDVVRLPRRGRSVAGPPARVDVLAGTFDTPAPLPRLPDLECRPPAPPPAAALNEPSVRLLHELYASAVDAMSPSP
jgi:hypothetical protein